ncbi:site-specific integrase [Nocardia sp. CA-119907]|uniref:site-specific integrase n=1 Tax=Nocardia sp. CA-119907 TaxID=3239973 RepID=UPI003D99C43A
MSPDRFDSRGRRVPDKDGSRAEAAVRAAASILAPDQGSGEVTARTTVAELWTAYRAYLVKKGRAENTLRLYDRWSAMLVAKYGFRRIGPEEFTTGTAESFLDWVAANHGRGSMLNARSMLSGMFRFAVRRGPLSVNPVREAEIPENVEAKGRTGGAAYIGIEDLCFILASVYWSTVPCPRKLTKAEQKRGIRSYTPPTVAEYCEGADLADLIAVMGAVGQRPSQVLGFAWPFYDRKRRTIQTVGKVIRVQGRGLVRVVKDNDPKNPQGTIALPDFAVEVLDRRWEQMQLRKHENPPPEDYDVDLIFPSFDWTLRDPVNVNHQWQRVREALGLPDDVSPYAFRKLVAVLLDDEGLSARVTADVLQHADPAMTQRKYMARGRVHHGAAAVIHNAVMGGFGHTEQEQEAEGPTPTFGRLSGEFRGLNTSAAPDRAN